MDRAALHDIALGPGGTILDVPKNKEMLAEIERAPLLTPRQMLKLAAKYQANEATRSLSRHLAEHAMRVIIQDEKVLAAVEKIKGEPVPWSFFGDLWGDVVGFFTGSNPNKPDGTPAPGASYPCEFKCVGFIVKVLVERCVIRGDNYGSWHVIGVCLGS